MIFPLPRTGPSRRCRLQFTTKIRLSSFSRPASEIAPSDSGSSISPSPRKAHTCRFAVSASPRVAQVLEEPRLVDRHERAQAHRHRGELPVVRHQPRVRVRRQAAAGHLLAEPEQLLLADAALEERAGVDPRGHVPLHEQQVAAVPLARGVPEVVEAGVVERGRRLERGDVPAQLRALLVRLEHGRDGVPPVQRADAVLDRQVTGVRRLLVDRDGVEVGGVRRVRHRHRALARLLVQLLQQERRPVRPVELHDGVERLQPFLGFARVQVLGHLRSLHCVADGWRVDVVLTLWRTSPLARPTAAPISPARPFGAAVETCRWAPSAVPPRTLPARSPVGNVSHPGGKGCLPDRPEWIIRCCAVRSASDCVRTARQPLSGPRSRGLMAGCRTSRGSPQTRPGGAPP